MVSFAKESVVVKAQDAVLPVERVVDGVLALRGHGTTDLAGALLVARRQLARSPAGRKITVLLSDCRATEDGDVVAAAGALDELAIIAPDGDAAAAVALAEATGAALTTVTGPAAAADALPRHRRERPVRAVQDVPALDVGFDANARARSRPDRLSR